MKKIGLTGSIASGKSEVARIFADHGVAVFDADQCVHDLYKDGTAARYLPGDFAGASTAGVVDRKKLSRILADNPALFSKLEQAIHPLVKQRMDEFFAAQRQMAIADVPLLLEKNRDSEFDCIVLVSAPEAARKKRALARPGMTEEKLAMIMARQLPDAEKRRRAHHIIENDNDLATLTTRTLALLDKLRNTHA